MYGSFAMAESSKNSNHCLYQPKWYLLNFYSNESCPSSEYTLKLFNLAGFSVLYLISWSNQLRLYFWLSPGHFPVYLKRLKKAGIPLVCSGTLYSIHLQLKLFFKRNFCYPIPATRLVAVGSPPTQAFFFEKPSRGNERRKYMIPQLNQLSITQTTERG